MGGDAPRTDVVDSALTFVENAPTFADNAIAFLDNPQAFVAFVDNARRSSRTLPRRL